MVIWVHDNADANSSGLHTYTAGMVEPDYASTEEIVVSSREYRVVSKQTKKLPEVLSGFEVEWGCLYRVSAFMALDLLRGSNHFPLVGKA